MIAEIRIVAEKRSGMEGWSVYDGQDWFAHATSRTDALHYASDLLHEGQGPRGSVWRQLEAIELLRTKKD
jgi:hypothetical protein